MDLKIWRRAAVERSGRGEKRETHGERQEADKARRRLVARTAAARRNRLDEFNPSPYRNGVDAVVAVGHLSTLVTQRLSLTLQRRNRSSRSVRSGGFDHEDGETRTHARGGTGIGLKPLRPLALLAYPGRRPERSASHISR